jgi:hypothetical protein
MKKYFSLIITVISISINVNSFGAIIGANTICEASISTYTMDPIFNATSYTWHLPNGWTGNSTTSSIDILFGSESGTLSVDVLLNNSSTVNFTFDITVETLPIASFTTSSDEVSVINPHVDFVNTSLNATNYTWIFGDTATYSSENISYDFQPKAGEYEVILVAQSNCSSDSSFLTIKVKDEFLCFIPNTFTPDGDAYNSTFLPVFTYGLDVLHYQLIIGNRSGGVLFESFDPKVGWDGSFGNENNIMASGVYPWLINYKDTFSDEFKTMSGVVNIVR